METAPINAFETLHGEVGQLSESLRGARIEEFNTHAAELESRLPTLLLDLRTDTSANQRQAAARLREEMLRMGALLEGVAAYARARLALEQPQADAYGPSGSPRTRRRRGPTQEA